MRMRGSSKVNDHNTSLYTQLGSGMRSKICNNFVAKRDTRWVGPLGPAVVEHRNNPRIGHFAVVRFVFGMLSGKRRILLVTMWYAICE